MVCRMSLFGPALASTLLLVGCEFPKDVGDGRESRAGSGSSDSGDLSATSALPTGGVGTVGTTSGGFRLDLGVPGGTSGGSIFDVGTPGGTSGGSIFDVGTPGGTSGGPLLDVGSPGGTDGGPIFDVGSPGGSDDGPIFDVGSPGGSDGGPVLDLGAVADGSGAELTSVRGLDPQELAAPMTFFEDDQEPAELALDAPCAVTMIDVVADGQRIELSCDAGRGAKPVPYSLVVADGKAPILPISSGQQLRVRALHRFTIDGQRARSIALAEPGGELLLGYSRNWASEDHAETIAGWYGSRSMPQGDIIGTAGELMFVAAP